MRQLTASQKIAILENRVAQLEKQAFLEEIKDSIVDFFSRIKSLISTLKNLISPIKNKISKQSITSFMESGPCKEAMKEVSKQGNLKSQLRYLVREHKKAKAVQKKMQRKAGWEQYVSDWQQYVQGWERFILDEVMTREMFYASSIFVAWLALTALFVYFRNHFKSTASKVLSGAFIYIVISQMTAFLFNGYGF
jgi:hypothetical protein